MGRAGWACRKPQGQQAALARAAPQPGKPSLGPNSTFPLCHADILPRHGALCDGTHLTLAFGRRFHKSPDQPGGETAHVGLFPGDLTCDGPSGQWPAAPDQSMKTTLSSSRLSAGLARRLGQAPPPVDIAPCFPPLDAPAASQRLSLGEDLGAECHLSLPSQEHLHRQAARTPGGAAAGTGVGTRER